ncbi:MAG: rhodanese-like domain-containing protein [Bacillota bacterium]|nr:rhodanese-like domain-containing protein [Bacillota bacterium]
MSEIKKVSFEEAKRILDTKPESIMLDVREEEEYITGHAVDAVLLPVDDIDYTLASIVIPEKTTPLLIYCRTGRRSAEAAEKLKELGYTELYDVGGLIGWPYGLE